MHELMHFHSLQSNCETGSSNKLIFDFSRLASINTTWNYDIVVTFPLGLYSYRAIGGLSESSCWKKKCIEMVIECINRIWNYEKIHDLKFMIFFLNEKHDFHSPQLLLNFFIYMYHETGAIYGAKGQTNCEWCIMGA